MPEIAQRTLRLYESTVQRLRARLSVAQDAKDPAETLLSAAASKLIAPQGALEVSDVTEAKVAAAAESLATSCPRVFGLRGDEPASGDAQARRKELKRHGII